MDTRLKSLDICRGLTGVYMVFFHSYMFLTRLQFGLSHTILNYFAMMFSTTYITVSGGAFFYFMNKNFENNMSNKEIFTVVFKRAFFIIMVTMFIQVSSRLIFGPDPELFIIHWSLFYHIALGMLLFFFIPYLKRIFRQIAYISIISLVFIANHAIYYYNISYLIFFVEGGTFPFLPWINFFVIGIFLGDLIRNAPEEEINKYILILLLSAVTLLTIWAIWIRENFYLYAFHFTFGTGVFIIMFLIFFYLSDIKKLNLWMQDRIIQWGHITFSLYYLHFLVIFAFMYIFAFFILYYLTTGLLLYQFIIFIIAFIIAVELSIRFWQKHEYKYSLEWSMRKFADFSFFQKKEKDSPN
ncbi:MAG: heparan-alpha-glucosaminide N-acetyltransferase domain-containing protein [Promethearchaeota archaeon]